MAPVITTGLLDFTVRWRKYEVSSNVAVPWVMATPATSGSSRNIWLIRRASPSHSAAPMAVLPTLIRSSDLTSAMS